VSTIDNLIFVCQDKNRSATLFIPVEKIIYNGRTGKVNKSFDGFVIMGCVDSGGKALTNNQIWFHYYRLYVSKNFVCNGFTCFAKIL